MSEFRKKYNEFVRSIELRKIFLQSLNCKRPLEHLKSVPLTADIKKPVFEITKNTPEVLIATGTFEVCIRSDTDTQGAEPSEEISIIASFVLEYSKSSNVEESDDIIQRFLNTNVPLNCWPYGREIISSITTRMGYPALIIPTIKVP